MLETTDPELLVRPCEGRLIRAFRRAAREVPAYRRLLLRDGVDPLAVSSIQDFIRLVPLLDKETVFAEGSLRDVCVGGTLDGIGSFYSSSGHSGTFSFGVSPWGEAETIAPALEFLLDSMFSVFERRTLLVNCLPMGVRIPTRTIPVADASVRSDVALALVGKLAGEFDQFILVGESLFLKKVLDEGAERGTPWRDLCVHIITGGEFVAESMRGYLGWVLGHDPAEPRKGTMVVNMGLSELGLSLFCETPATAQIRRLAFSDPELLRALGGDPTEACPAILQYNPLSVFAETVRNRDGRAELVISPLGLDLKLPLMRYNTGDEGHILTYRELESILSRFGHQALLPRFHLPCAVVSGRKRRVPVGEGQWLSPHEVKQAIYQDHDIAQAVTGNFRLSADEAGAMIRVQLRNGRQAPQDAADRLALHLGRYMQAPARISLLPFTDASFGLVHDYQRKPRYVEHSSDTAI